MTLRGSIFSQRTRI